MICTDPLFTVRVAVTDSENGVTVALLAGTRLSKSDADINQVPVPSVSEQELPCDGSPLH
jgi:hypothetical protein